MERLAVLELWSKNTQDSKIAVVSKQTREVATETDYIVYEISDDDEVSIKVEIMKAEVLMFQFVAFEMLTDGEQMEEIQTLNLLPLIQLPLFNAEVVQLNLLIADVLQLPHVEVVQSPMSMEMDSNNYEEVEDIFGCLDQRYPQISGKSMPGFSNLVSYEDSDTSDSDTSDEELALLDNANEEEILEYLDENTDNEQFNENIIVLSSDSESDEPRGVQYNNEAIQSYKTEAAVFEEPPAKKRKYQPVDIDNKEKQVLSILMDYNTPPDVNKPTDEECLQSTSGCVDIGIENIRLEVTGQISFLDGKIITREQELSEVFVNHYLAKNRKIHPKAGVFLKNEDHK